MAGSFERGGRGAADRSGVGRGSPGPAPRRGDRASQPQLPTRRGLLDKTKYGCERLRLLKQRLGIEVQEAAAPASFVDVTSQVMATSEPGGSVVGQAIGRILV